ncbi:PspC domain-containing protein [Mariniflexile litorale]|uniref:PspC domain-containing protein n=1 Tax=Mariniflexile litorale TaxID=3045158 RepID=A0AAU7EGU2_9FLAO|nr:PspC domain-containing protein [Mariniflexile sp. KMM 9835]MDQ8210718.1 PspC domain-containing protein [Mariniflexile sp. KMM 9835]
MNKTVNINLAGTFFHIDEDAYLKLQRYLEAIKRSFTDSQGRNEIIADIEARIAELFSERVQNDKQVIRIKEVEEVISIMGQPEDYLVDDEIFEDELQPAYQRKSSASKKLFRDTDNSYIGGVASGLGHYLGIDAVWVRLLWVLLTVGSGGTFIFIYILFWILVPEAITTAEKIMMTGDPVNISNIEKKIKDGFDTVSETVSGVAKNVSDSVSGAAKNVSDAAKKADFQRQGNKIKSSSKSFFDTLADIIMFFFKIFAKFIGIIFIIVGAFALIALIISWFSVGIADIVHIPGMDFVNIAIAGNSPVWLASLLLFFAIGIPFFFLFYLGLKILVNNLKSIGNIAKFTLLGLWLFSIIGLVVIGLREASEHAFNERITEKKELLITANDTLEIKMTENDLLRNRYYRHDSFKVANNENGEKTIYRSDISIIIKSTTDTLASISIEKSADGRNYDIAIDRAKKINYNYILKGQELRLDSYLSTHSKNKFSDQEIVVILYLPEGAVVKFNNNTKHYLNNRIASNYINQYLNVDEDGVICKDCDNDEFEVDIDTPNIKINENGIEIKGEKSSLKINDSGINAESEEVKVKIDGDGINIKSDN